MTSVCVLFGLCTYLEFYPGGLQVFRRLGRRRLEFGEMLKHVACVLSESCRPGDLIISLTIILSIVCIPSSSNIAPSLRPFRSIHTVSGFVATAMHFQCKNRRKFKCLHFERIFFIGEFGNSPRVVKNVCPVGSHAFDGSMLVPLCDPFRWDPSIDIAFRLLKTHR